MKISEIFHSLQGEGSLIGTPSVFIRTSLCNLRCSWCDTPYTSWEPEYYNDTVDKVLEETKRLVKINGSTTRHVVITGGEPFLQRDELVELCKRLSRESFHITIETNGTIFIPLDAQLISISPKLSNSTPLGSYRKAHESVRINLDSLRAFINCNSRSQNDLQIKFVIETESDLTEVADLEREVSIPKDNIYLMPQSCEREDLATKSHWLTEICLRTGYSFSPRLQIEYFGNKRGT